MAKKVFYVSDLMLYSIDMSKNEVEGLKIYKNPTFKLYMKDNKEAPLDHYKKDTQEDLMEFLEKYIFDM